MPVFSESTQSRTNSIFLRFSTKSLNQNLNPIIGSDTYLMKCHMIPMIYVQSVQRVINPSCSPVVIFLKDTLAIKY